MACQQRRNSQAAAAGAGLDDADLRFSRYQYRCAKSRGEGRNGEASGACRRQTAEVTSSSNGLSSVAGGLAQNECAAGGLELRAVRCGAVCRKDSHRVENTRQSKGVARKPRPPNGSSRRLKRCASLPAIPRLCSSLARKRHRLDSEKAYLGRAPSRIRRESALPPIATEERTFGIGSSVPIASECSAASNILFDHLIGAHQHSTRRKFGSIGTVAAACSSDFV